MIIPKRLIFQDESYFHDNRLPSGLEPLNLFPTGLNAHYQTRHLNRYRIGLVHLDLERCRLFSEPTLLCFLTVF